MYALIISADDKHQERIASLLGEVGFSTVSVWGSRAAFLHLAEKRPDFIVLDQGMPKIYDVEFLPLTHRLSRAPIIVFGEEGESNVVAALKQGADVYLTPAVSDEEFLTRVQAVMMPPVIDGKGRPSPDPSVTIASLEVTEQIERSLHRAGVITVADVLAKSERELLRIPQFGPGRYTDLFDLLREKGFVE